MRNKEANVKTAFLPAFPGSAPSGAGAAVTSGSSPRLHLPHASPCSGVVPFHTLQGTFALGPQSTSSSSSLGLPSASSSVWCFPPFLNPFPEAPPSWFLSHALRRGCWNQPCPAQGSPSLSSQRAPCCLPCQHLATHTQCTHLIRLFLTQPFPTVSPQSPSPQREKRPQHNPARKD